MDRPTVARATSDVSQPASKPRSIILRLHWMILGAAALATCALFLLQGGHSAVSLPSFAMWGIAASMVGARWLDISRFHGLTADGVPATTSHLRRYALGVGAATAALWSGALAIG